MKQCKCKGGCKLGKLFGKLIGIALLANVALFVVFFFDLDGKLLFNVVEPFLKKHYDNMERKRSEDFSQYPRQPETVEEYRQHKEREQRRDYHPSA